MVILHQPHPWPIVLLALGAAAVPLIPWSPADKAVAVALIASGGALEVSSGGVARAADAALHGRVAAHGIVRSTPRRTDRYVTADIMLLDGRNRSTGLLLRAHVPDTTLAPHAGDTLEVRGGVRPLVAPLNPGETDWSRLLRQRGIIGRLWADEVVLRVAPSHRSPREVARSHIEATLSTHAHGERGALAVAMLIGIRDLLDQDTMTSFRDAGLVHVLSISGFHVGIVAALLLVVAGTLLPGYRLPSLTSLIGVACYVILVGAYPPVLRAGIMCAVVLLGLALGRRAEGINSLGVSGLFLLCAQPQWLWEAGFQLSFGATLGILVFTPPMLRIVRGMNRAVRWCVGSMLTSLSAQLGVLPILLFWFRQWPTYSLVANIPAVLLATVLIGAALATAIAQLIWTGLASAAGRVTEVAAGTLLWVADRVAGLPLAVLSFGDTRLWILTILWAAVAGGRIGKVWGRPLMPAIGAACGAMCVWIGWTMTPWEAKIHRISFLHVPGGNCVVVEEPEACGLLDVGSGGRPESAARIARDHLRFRRRGRVSVLGATGSNGDRFGSVEALTAELRPERVVIPSSAELASQGALVERWRDAPRHALGSGFTLEPLGAGATSLDGLLLRSTGGLKVLVAGDGGWRSDARCATWAAVESTDVLYVGPWREMAPSPLLLRRARPRLVVLGGGTEGEDDLGRDLGRQGYRVATTSRGAVTIECVSGEVRWRHHGRP